MNYTIYIAAPFARKADGIAVRGVLQEMGHTVTSSWLDEPDAEGAGLPSDPETCREMSLRDFADIRSASVLLVLTDPRPIGVGHHVELGYALASDLVVVVAGPVKSVFHHLASRIFPSWAAAKMFFEQERTPAT